MWHLLLGRGDRGKAAVMTGKKRNSKRATRRSFFEPLEERRVLATLVLDAGTSGDDTIDISGNGSNIIVKRDGNEIHNVSTSGFDFVQINAAGGDDTINLLSLPSGSSGTDEVLEVEGNDTYLTAQVLPAAWSLTPNAHINDDLANPINLPHITVKGTYDGTHDVYKFHVTVGAGEVVTGFFDIDSVDQTKFDAYLDLLDASGNVIPFAESDDAPIPDLLAGSAAYNGTDTYDPLFGFVFPEGSHDYYIRVKESPFPGVILNGTPSYDLQVVVSNYPTGGAAPGIIINGGTGSDTLNVASGLMLPLSAVDENVLAVGLVPFAGTLLRGTVETASYINVETFNGGAAFTVLTDLVALGQQDGVADSTWVRGNAEGTKLLVDVNSTTYFTGGLNQILIVAVNGSSDADTILVENTAAKSHIHGGAGDDTITTGDAPDIVYGGDGNDVIRTNGGDDYVAGGAGNDTVYGGDGNDSLHGNAGDDILAGEGGHDILSGGAGNDHISGQKGQDVLIGGSGADQVIGNYDRDLLFASGVVVWEGGVPISLGESDSSQFGDDNYFRLQTLRQDWLDVVALALSFEAFANKYDSGPDDGVEDKLQGGQGDDVFFSDGTAKIIDSADDQELTT
ncbi:MAG TPA: calcium-binding protein [Pirellulaceae bacterium]|nr:calcium-binding protein [Pirellulaceae bacterium]